MRHSQPERIKSKLSWFVWMIRGKPYYMTTIPAKQFVVTGLNANINDGSVLVIGNSPTDGGLFTRFVRRGTSCSRRI